MNVDDLIYELRNADEVSTFVRNAAADRLEAALSTKPEVVRDCATEGCEKQATVRFERHGVGSDYCRECYLKVQALRSTTYSYDTQPPTPASGEQMEVVALPEGTLSKCENDVTIAFDNDADAVTAFVTLEAFMFRPSKAARELCEELTSANERAERLDEAARAGLRALGAAEALNTTLSGALETERTWHEEQDKSLSKQPSSTGPNGTQWARLQHQERIAEINTALAALPAKQGGQS